MEQDLHATIDGKAIIYRGKTQPCTQGISYININDFLTEPMAFLNVMRNYYQGESWNSSLCQIYGDAKKYTMKRAGGR